MSGLSSSGEAAVLAPLTASPHVSLHTADPGDTGANEISGGGYARQGPVTFANAGTNPTVASNSAIVTYSQATVAWGAISYFGIWTSGGTFQGSGAITPAPVTVNSGDTARFATGALMISAN